MKTARFVSILVGAAGLALPNLAMAAEIRVQPVTVEPLAGARTGSLTLINEEQKPLRVQMRVFRWSQENGQDRLTPTNDVVASPPITTVAPGQHALVRIVRTAKGAIAGEEAYRVLVDELPDPAETRPGTVNLVIRKSIPIFFSDTPQRSSVVNWSIERSGSGSALVAKNSGSRRLRLSDVVIEDHDDILHHQDGLVGYVLAGETMRWPIQVDSAKMDERVHLRAVSDTGVVQAFLADAPGS